MCNEERIDTERAFVELQIWVVVVSGLITFTIEGNMIISPYVGAANESRLHIFKGMKVDLQPSTKLLAYLEYHRDVLYVK